MHCSGCEATLLVTHTLYRRKLRDRTLPKRLALPWVRLGWWRRGTPQTTLAPDGAEPETTDTPEQSETTDTDDIST